MPRIEAQPVILRPMEVRSLAYQTDLGIRRLGGAIVSDHGDHLVVETPGNRGFWWGNFILLASAPRQGEAERLEQIFRAAFPTAAHLAFGVDGTDGDTGDAGVLAELGLEVEVNAVLVADSLREPRPAAEGAVLRRLRDDDDWSQAAGLRLRVYEDTDDGEQRTFVERQLSESREICERGDGGWFGAFVDGRLVSALGLLRALPETGRYQTVETLEAHRRRGFAGRLLYEASRWGTETLGINRLIICADPEYHALRLYVALGFTVVERQVQLQRPPRPATPVERVRSAEDGIHYPPA